MLDEICAYLKNYFCLKDDKIYGDFSVVNGAVTPSFNILPGQYYRIIGSVFNDGIHKAEDVLTDEPSFHGAVWLMRIPQDILAIADDIAAWQKKYGDVESPNMSPYQSESFGGYSYSKQSNYYSSAESSAGTWKKAFASRLAPYRRIRVL